jgi:hypothetical protein
MMLKFFDVFTADSVSITGVGDVARLVPARDELLRFGAHYIAFKQWIWMYWIARRHLYLDLASALGPLPALTALMDAPAEPPDFFALQPENVPDVPLEHRGLWFRGLASFVEPFSPDRSDAVMREHAERLATIMGESPARCDDLAAEVASVTGAPAHASARVARAVGMYAALDALLGDVLTSVEAGFRGDSPAAFDAAMRDRVLRAPARDLFAAFAPKLFVEIARP